MPSDGSDGDRPGRTFSPPTVTIRVTTSKQVRRDRAAEFIDADAIPGDTVEVIETREVDGEFEEFDVTDEVLDEVMSDVE